MKKVYALLIVSLFACAARGQISFAPEIGYLRSQLPLAYDGMPASNLGVLRVTNMYKGGFRVGSQVLVPLGKSFDFQPGVFYCIKGAKRTYFVDRGRGASFTSETFSIHWMEVPLKVRFHFPIDKKHRFAISGGPYMSVAFAGKYTFLTSYDNYPPQPFSSYSSWPYGRDTSFNMTFGNDFSKNNSRQMDWGAELGLSLIHASGYFFSMTYQRGFRNLVPEDNQAGTALAGKNSRIYNSCFSFSVGKEFGRIRPKPHSTDVQAPL